MSAKIIKPRFWNSMFISNSFVHFTLSLFIYLLSLLIEFSMFILTVAFLSLMIFFLRISMSYVLYWNFPLCFIYYFICFICLNIRHIEIHRFMTSCFSSNVFLFITNYTNVTLILIFLYIFLATNVFDIMFDRFRFFSSFHFILL